MSAPGYLTDRDILVFLCFRFLLDFLLRVELQSVNVVASVSFCQRM